MSVALYVIYLISLVKTGETAGEQCKVYQVAIHDKALRGHTYKTAKVGELFSCYVRCERDPACKSCNFKHTHDICELNNETKETRPNDFITDEQSYYIKHTGGDVDECTAFPNICDANADCHNTDGSYICHCKAGYTGDGKNCSRADVNQCENGQTNLCGKYAFCINTKGSYSCHCKQGFVGDGFNCTAIIPHPSAWFPLNGTYDTSEIQNRTPSGSKGHNVFLSLGPDGTQDGSYFFRGAGNSHIIFSDINLDTRGSITILCWLYTYKNNFETVFLQYKNATFSLFNKTLYASKNASLNGRYLTGTLAEKGWVFVGVSYNKTSAKAHLWIDGNKVNSTGLPADFIFPGSHFLKLGGNNFKGKITQLMLFKSALTQEQIQGIKGRINLPAIFFNSAIISSNLFYRSALAPFLAPVVGQIESKWKLCHSALANGWDPRIFHTNCDKKKHTVTIIEKKPYIFGGYTDIPWESSSPSHWRTTLKTFIFSLRNSESLPPFKCLAKYAYRAIYRSPYFGPSFGRKPDLYVRHRRSRARIGAPYSVPPEVRILFA
ncbi:uncharacterized protein LOC141860103 [Acropora palmata]|uniref:uncharacterized protein LOC141860103 n=1 Tax=Acropora palmata TaxID=6131 RepID=UPI003DA14973